MAQMNDGLVTIYGVQNAASPGKMPKKELERKGQLRFQRRTVGISRHYTALQAGARVDLLLRVPYIGAVSAQDVAVPTIDGKQYRIELIQVPEGEQPPVMDLTLRRLERDYELP